MTDTTQAPPPPAAPPSETTPWYNGIDADTLGWAQNRGIKLDDPKEAFATSLKQVRDFEKHFGVPPEQLLKMPKPDAKPEDHKAFWARLGAGEPKDYDLSSVKMSGDPLPENLATAIQNALASAYVPKDKGATIAAAVAKELESSKTAEISALAGKLAEEKAKLAANWGVNKDFNLLKAMEGARRLGPEFVAALESAKDSPGYAAIMEGMRKIGVGTSEDTFIERGASGGPGQGIGVTTREGAASRKAELMADKDWGKRYLAGDSAAAREMNTLNMMIDGDS